MTCYTSITNGFKKYERPNCRFITKYKLNSSTEEDTEMSILK